MKSKRFRFWLCASLLASASGCAAPRAAPVVVVEDEPAPPPPIPEFPYALAWTARPEVVLRTDDGEVRIPNVFTRLNVTAVDTLGIQVECLYCIPASQGWATREDLVYEPLPPSVAASRGLADLLLMVRSAAENRDEAALRAVMSSRFTYSFEGGGGGVDAFRRWEFQGFRALDNLVPLLDRGLVTRDSVIWTAPPRFVEDPEYQGLRAGFRRGPDDRWEWIYLVGG